MIISDSFEPNGASSKSSFNKAFSDKPFSIVPNESDVKSIGDVRIDNVISASHGDIGDYLPCHSFIIYADFHVRLADTLHIIMSYNITQGRAPSKVEIKGHIELQNLMIVFCWCYPSPKG